MEGLPGSFHLSSNSFFYLASYIHVRLAISKIEPFKVSTTFIVLDLFVVNFCCSTSVLIPKTGAKARLHSVSIKNGLRTTDYGLRNGYKTRTQV